MENPSGMLRTPMHKALLAIMAGSLPLLFYRLGDLALDPDEGTIIRWATTLYHSDPSIVDLIQHFVRDKGFYGVYPGLNIYLTVLSFRVFGISTWAARLPAVLIAVGTIPLFYRVADRILRNPTAALFSTLTFATSAPLLFLMRQCRYTSLTICATLWFVWAYLDLLERKPSGLPQCIGAMVLFFYTSFYIFVPVAVGVTLHCLLCTRGRSRRMALLVFVSVFLGVTLAVPSHRLSWHWPLDFLMGIWQSPPVTMLNNLRLCANEINLVGLPYALVVVFLIVTRHARSAAWLPWTAGLLWGGFVVTSSPFMTPVFEGGRVWLDQTWPGLSPWVFTRLADPRSYFIVIVTVMVSLVLRELWKPGPNAVHQLSLPILILIGTTVAFSLVFTRLVWTRYLAGTITLSFIIVGFMLDEIRVRHRPLAIILLLLIVTSNVLSAVPLLAAHPAPWQWKLPHWVSRLASGDPCADIVLNFWLLLPL